MIMPDNRGPSPSRPPVRREQRFRIDLERPRRVRRDIRTYLGRLDPPRSPEQQPANLRIRRRSRLSQQSHQQFA